MLFPSRTSRWAALGLLAAPGFVACIAAPHLSPVDDTQTVPANLPGADASEPAPANIANMVFVPGIAIEIPDKSAASNGQGDGNDGANDKGNGKKDAGAPPPPPPAVPSTTHLEVAGFWIDVHEVAVDSFRACVVAGGCSVPAASAGCTLEAGLASHPVNCVTIEQARAYCAWQTKRLVRNDEWTAAAAGAEQRPYPWGPEPPSADRLNACGRECAAAGMYAASDGQVRTAPRGAFPLGRTPEGVEDLAGNVAEWVEGGPVAMARGGSFEDVDVTTVRSFAARAGAASATVGFRCAADR